MTKNIVLVGLMGSGKTTAGKLIAEKSGKIFVDTDELIEQETKKSINEIFEAYGEAYFRDLEIEIIKRVSLSFNQVISTGGGAVENLTNINNLKKNGVIFYLYAPANKLFDRIKNEINRPLLRNNNPLDTLEKLLDKREKFYSLADVKIITIDRQIEEIISEIEEKYKNYEY